MLRAANEGENIEKLSQVQANSSGSKRQKIYGESTPNANIENALDAKKPVLEGSAQLSMAQCDPTLMLKAHEEVDIDTLCDDLETLKMSRQICVDESLELNESTNVPTERNESLQKETSFMGKLQSLGKILMQISDMFHENELDVVQCFLTNIKPENEQSLLDSMKSLKPGELNDLNKQLETYLNVIESIKLVANNQEIKNLSKSMRKENGSKSWNQRK